VVTTPTRSNGRSGPRAKKRRREIIDAAAQVFFEKGYDASSTQDIADAAGILKGSLYYYIRSKEDFLFEIVQETHEGALRNLDPTLAAPGDVLAKLAMFVIRQVEYFAAHNVYATVFFREYRALSAERRRPIESKGDLYRLFVSDLLRQGISEGKVNADIDVRTASISIVEMLNSIHRWYRPGGRQSASRIARDFATVLVVGIASAQAIEERGGIDAFRRELRELKVGGLVPFS
jgi:AcrR family transcriptional regulator